jgi:hypothetical protein
MGLASWARFASLLPLESNPSSWTMREVSTAISRLESDAWRSLAKGFRLDYHLRKEGIRS